LLLSGNVMIDRRYLERAGNVVLENADHLDLFQRWAKAGTANGNHFWVQLSHPGRQCSKLINNQPLSPPNVQLHLLAWYGKPRPMTEDDIQDVIERFATSARLVKEAGFTGVQIHGAHGYLLSQFLNPLVNKRQDHWGGSLENRARLLRTVVQEVRKAVGPEFPVSVKLNSSDFQKGGFTLEECVKVAQWLGEDSVDLLEISGGSYEQLSLIGVAPRDVRDSTRKREAYFIEYAASIKSAAKIPVMITGGFRSREVMESALQNGETDLIGLARPLCTQPDCSAHLITQTQEVLDDYEHSLVLGHGFWGNNSSSATIRSINAQGQVGFYYWQIIRLSQGLKPETTLTAWRAFWRHMRNDFALSRRRKSTP
jgi:2,4-dienoyl-CoA reductase-like NADH-dependent reductase (Old Yellow Enzyme family)